EFTFDRYLRTGEPTTLSYFTDARKRPLQGLDMRLYSPSNPYYPVKVMTTLDLTIQNKVDELLEAKGIENGAIVILNADNADVLAMSSSPSFHPQQYGKSGIAWSNKA